ncbi:MAG: ATP-binding protein [Chloroflexota bacterium]
MIIHYHRRFFLLIIILSAVSLLSAGIAILVLYRTALRQQEVRLIEIVESQARLIEAIADTTNPETALNSIRQSQTHFNGLAKTGEFVIGRRKDDHIEFLLSVRHKDAINVARPPAPPWFGEGAESVRRAIAGQSGTLIDIDYRQQTVLAAYEPVRQLGWGIIAKIDLAEIQTPFFDAARYTVGATLLIVLVGTLLFFQISSPILRGIEESEAKNRAILETAPDGIITFDQSGMIRSINKAAQMMFGYRQNQIVNQRLHLLIPGLSEYAETISSPDTADVLSVEDKGREFMGRHQQGTTFPAALSMSIFGQTKRRIFIISIRDITEQKAMERALRTTQDDLELRVKQRTHALNQSNKILQIEIKQREQTELQLAKINACFLAFGHNPIENINRLTVLCGELLQATVALYQCLNNDKLHAVGQWQTPSDFQPVQSAKGHLCYDVIQQCGDEVQTIRHLPSTTYAQTDPNVGHYHLQTYVGRPVRRGDQCIGTLSVAFQHDFKPTEADKRLMGMIAAAIGIEEERRQVEATLAETRDQALAASRFKSELLAKVSHEFRTPLGAVLGYAEVLQVQVFGSLSTDQADLVSHIIGSANYLTELVNELLDQAKLDAGQLLLNNNEFFLGEMLDQVYSQMDVLAQAKGLHFSISVDSNMPILLHGDITRLQQILVNLISNAIKFTKVGRVEVRIALPDSTMWRIQVTDTGIGIPNDVQTSIFQPFSQVDGSITRENGGTGLGLSIVKQLVSLMEGEIRVESHIGHGSTFEILLPLNVAQQPQTS